MIDTADWWAWRRADIGTEAALLAEGISYVAAVDDDGVRYLAPIGTSGPPGVPVETVYAHGAERRR